MGTFCLSVGFVWALGLFESVEGNRRFRTGVSRSLGCGTEPISGGRGGLPVYYRLAASVWRRQASVVST